MIQAWRTFVTCVFFHGFAAGREAAAEANKVHRSLLCTAAPRLLPNVARTRPVLLGNKYAQYSKAAQPPAGLRFSNVKPSSEPRDAAPKKARRARARWEYPDAALVDQQDPSTYGFSEVGVVRGAHGVTGELKVRSESDFAAKRLGTRGVRIWLRRPGRRAPREELVARGRPGPGTRMWLVTLDSVRSREEAQALRGATLFVRRELCPTLGDGEMMLWELQGLTARRAERDEQECFVDGPLLGTVTGVIPKEEVGGPLGNDLLELTLPGDVGDTVLVPLVPQIVVDIRADDGVMLLDPPAGLLDLVQPKRKERVVIRGLLPPRAESLQREGT